MTDTPNGDTGSAFAAVPRWLQGKLDPYQLAAYVALQWHADRDGVCWPSHKALAAAAGMSQRKLAQVLTQLRDAGIVTWEHQVASSGAQFSNRYHVAGVTRPPQFSVQTPTHQQTDPHAQPADKQEPRNKNQGTIGLSPSLRSVDSLGETQREKQTQRDTFDEFWQVAVRKTAKGAARVAYAKALRKTDPATLSNAWQLANDVWEHWRDRHLIPHPSTWLNQERWEDDPPEGQQTDLEKRAQERARQDDLVQQYHEATDGMDLLQRAEARIAASQQQQGIGQ